ncbi:MAG TPA: class II aldolase/adducin family protein [Bryobacteraceae bacterium]|jgi:rhamnose utilization protein RhaD (predicted bifunctional aldolase and dehydrogenase)|nr:class II aldolase/adducin family protein [Bryobacteraceae bacterium]
MTPHPVHGRSTDDELNALQDFSARIGRDPLLVQGATGNTSIKLGGTLWIKASGKWLLHAKSDDIFLPVPLEDVRQSIRTNTRYVFDESGHNGKLQPSVETAMHAVLPHRVVVHVHSVSAIAHAVRRDGQEVVARRLHGLAWRWIPYVASGLPLALEIQKALRPTPEVLILANHGVVVGAPDCKSAERLLEDLEQRLAIPPRKASPRPRSISEPEMKLPNEPVRAAETSWLPCPRQPLQRLALDPVSQGILRGGTLYPCHAIFLGPAVAFASSLDQVAESIAAHKRDSGRPPAFLIVKDECVLLSSNISPVQLEILEGLLQVVERLEADTPIRYLTRSEVAALDGSESARYRQLAQGVA